MKEKELIIYRNPESSTLLEDMVSLMERYRQQEDRGLVFSCMNRLLELASSHGFYGNLWHCYLADYLVNHENSYSMACEIRGDIEGSINDLVLHDIEIFRGWYRFDFGELIQTLQVPQFAMLFAYEADPASGRIYNIRIRDRICELARQFDADKTAVDMKKSLTAFYKDYGVGRFGLHKAFRVNHTESGAEITPIRNIAHVRLDDLVGYEIPKKKLTDNTEAFVSGRKANNCLLFGDAGTGKSSSIKAVANEYYDRGLRIIELYKHQLKDLSDVIVQIKNRNYKFIIYMDDLSFEDFETEYKYLKAVIEGGLEKKPDNVLIYATSNRRHLIREKFSDKEDRRDDLHAGDTVQEKLSLAYRFGVTIYFGSPDKKQFQQIVSTLADRYGVTMDKETLLAEANKWELAHGGLSGRTAQQFIDYLSGQE